MIYEFTNEEESLFQQCISDNMVCVSRRYHDKMVVLTEEDIPVLNETNNGN